MRIEIATRFRPYSVRPGCAALIPGSSWALRGHPTRLEFFNLITSKEFAIDLPLTGIMENFTLMQDLESRAIILFGTAKEGYVRLMITHKDDIQITVKRAPSTGLTIGKKTLKAKDIHTIKVDEQSFLPPYVERLSLGCHKAQDIDLIHRRSALEEILPLWHFLGQLTPPTPCAHEEGTLTYLKRLSDDIIACDRFDALQDFKKLFIAGFSDLFVPRIIDDQHQGIVPEIDAHSSDLSPLTLLSEGAQLIRTLFFSQQETNCAFLPCLPPDFHSGRYLNGHAKFFNFDLEWSKKQLRRLHIRPTQDTSLTLHLHKIKTFRIRTSPRSKGHTHKASDPLDLHKNTPLYLDNFKT